MAEEVDTNGDQIAPEAGEETGAQASEETAREGGEKATRIGYERMALRHLRHAQKAAGRAVMADEGSDLPPVAGFHLSAANVYAVLELANALRGQGSS